VAKVIKQPQDINAVGLAVVDGSGLPIAEANRYLAHLYATEKQRT